MNVQGQFERWNWSIAGSSNRPLSLGGHVESQQNKKLFLHGKPRTEFASGRGLPCENKAFYSPETQHDRRVIRVYQAPSLDKHSVRESKVDR